MVRPAGSEPQRGDAKGHVDLSKATSQDQDQIQDKQSHQLAVVLHCGEPSLQRLEHLEHFQQLAAAEDMPGTSSAPSGSWARSGRPEAFGGFRLAIPLLLRPRLLPRNPSEECLVHQLNAGEEGNDRHASRFDAFSFTARAHIDWSSLGAERSRHEERPVSQGSVLGVGYPALASCQLDPLLRLLAMKPRTILCRPYGSSLARLIELSELIDFLPHPPSQTVQSSTAAT
eukprot:751645-Hanusia_phi.AAC.3